MNVLVVGANGFLGRWLVAGLMERGDQITAAYHRGTEHIPSGIPTVPAHELDTLPDTFDVIHIVGARIPYDRLDEPSPALVEANILLPARISSRFQRARIIYASSVAVYGRSTGVLDEESPHQGITRYGQSKLAGEFVVRNHPSFAVVRFSSLYGRGMSNTTFLPRLLEMARSTQELLVYGDGSRRQDYLHITDAARFMIAASEASQHGTFLGVYGKSVSNVEVAGLVAELIPGTSIRTTGTDPSPSFVYDNSRTIQILGSTPSVSLRAGLQELIG